MPVKSKKTNPENNNFESEVMFKILLNNIPLPIFYKDIDGKYLECNEEFEKFLGLKKLDIIGKSVYDLSNKETADKYFEKDIELFNNPGRQVYPWIVKSKTGEIRNVVFHKASVNDKFGKVTGLIGMIVDITETKNYENILKQKQIELERSNNDLEQFAFTVSHDLQEPLRMISSFTDLLKKKYSEKLDEQGLSYINFTVEGAKRMHNLIQGLLTYSRISTQANPFELVELREPLNIALVNLSMAVKESSAEIIIGDLPKVYADKYQLSSVFMNLISNAIKFRKEGEKLIIEIDSRELKEQNMFEISVKDNGIGIDSKHFGNIFLIFHRLHSQDKYPGTGIGLSVCKKIIERHGGCIKVESEINAGTTFYFTLKPGV